MGNESFQPSQQIAFIEVNYDQTVADGNTITEYADEIAGEVSAERIAQESEITMGGMGGVMGGARRSRAIRWVAGLASTVALLAPAAVAAAPKHTGRLERKCAAKILEGPTIEASFMQNAGKRNQAIFLKLGFGEVPKKCDRRFRRAASAMPRLIKGHKPINMDGPFHGNKFWDQVYAPPASAKSNRAGEGGLINLNSSHLKIRTWRPGNKVDFRLRLQEEDRKTGQILRTKIKKYPIDQIYRGEAPKSVQQR